MSEHEEDYMSDAFLNPSLDVRPGIPMMKRLKETLRRGTLHKEKNILNQQKSYKEQEQNRRDAALQSSLSSENKGFALLQKMGYTAGQGLGKEGTGRVEPLPLTIKTDRGGIGMEQLKKRKAEESLENYRKRLEVKQQIEKKSLEDFRERKRTEREKHETEGDLRKSQWACEQLDRQKGIIVPRDVWYWPEVVKNQEADHEELSTGSEGSEEDNELTSLLKLQFITSYLRSVHFYCIWCGTAYRDEADINTNCPGDTALNHNE
ncbi:G patch domain-containing protein 11 [Ictalurus furcatus]|uniref:G patch domain-containing protein 11 n=1 Tax=Ictalurus furcatus TaxID=66913 RepID=UPI0023505648|nr:G patch domain-containing protein 11 [Ictalurus furcatus]